MAGYERGEIPRKVGYSRQQQGFAPSDLSGLIGWWDFSDVATLFTDTGRTSAVTADGDSIGGVTDKSGSGNHMIQGTGSKQPTYKVNIQNGKSVARYDGGDALQRASMVIQTHKTVFVVVQQDSTATGLWLIEHSANAGGGNNGFFFYGAINKTVTTTVGTSHDINADAGASWYGTSWAQAVHSYDGSYVLRKNGADEAFSVVFGTSRTDTAITDDLNLGSRNEASVFMVGDWGECLVYNGALSATNISTVEAYLSAKWGV